MKTESTYKPLYWLILALLSATAVPVLFNSAEGRVKTAEGSSRFAVSDSSTTFLPLVLNHWPYSKGIYGRVTFHGVSAAGIPLMLRFYNGTSWSTYATNTTALDGSYSFTGVPGLNPGQAYYVRFQNSAKGPETQLWYWSTGYITSYGVGTQVSAGDFDIANISLVAPSNAATVSLPYMFQWTLRPATPSDNYELVLFEPYGTHSWTKVPPFGYVSSGPVTSLPTGVFPYFQYGWYMGASSPDGGYGESFYYRWVTFANSGHAPSPMYSDKRSRDLPEDSFPRPTD